MKRLAIAVVLLVVLLSVSGYSLWSLHQLTTQLTQTAQQLRELPTDGPLEEASRDLVRQWEKAEDQLVLYVNHEKLERISQTAAELLALAQYEDYSIFYSKVDLLITQLDGLWEESLPNYRNLL